MIFEEINFVNTINITLWWLPPPPLYPVIPDVNCADVYLKRCRYIAFTPDTSESIDPQAFRITVKECPQFPYMETPENRTYWVGPVGSPDDGGDTGRFAAFASLQPVLTPDCFYEGFDCAVILVGDNSQIVPSTVQYGTTTYTVEAYNGIIFSEPVDLNTAVWGDCFPALWGWMPGPPCYGPDHVCEGFDILMVLDCAQGVIYQSNWERSFTDMAFGDTVVEGFDILAVIDAANGLPFPEEWAPVPNV